MTGLWDDIMSLQVAEMHGELMEFNELLQKQLLCRESQLKHLTEELVSLRGPVCFFSLSVSRIDFNFIMDHEHLCLHGGSGSIR